MDTLIREDLYPEAYTYRGKAYYANLEVTTLAVPVIFDGFVDWVADSCRTNIESQGAHVLIVRVYRDVNFWNYFYRVVFYCYDPNDTTYSSEYRMELAPIIAAIIYLIIGAIAAYLIGWLVSTILRGATDLIYGPEEIRNKYPWISALIPIAIILGVATIGGGFLLGKIGQLRQPIKDVSYGGNKRNGY